MGLPVELLPYAENFFRRFPEEFITLGAPGLEEVFDLRTNGTWSRKIQETPMEKTVTINIQRWPPGAAMSFPQAHPGPSPQLQAAYLQQQAAYMPQGSPYTASWPAAHPTAGPQHVAGVGYGGGPPR